MPANGGNANTVNGHTVLSNVPANAKFTDTDTKVTSAANHYTPSTSANVTKAASDGAITDITNSADGAQVMTGITMDAKGHVTGVTSIALKSTNTDTKYTHPNSGVTAGTYRSVTVNAQGHITKGTNPTTLSGYGITDAAAKSHTHDDRYYTETEIDAKLATKLDSSLKGANNGIAELDENGKVPSSQLPSYVDDVLEYDKLDVFPETGESGKIYVDKATNMTYRWTGTAYVEISKSLALGETSATAYRGDRGKIAYTHSQSAHAPSNAQKNVQSDWNVTDTSSDAYIANKPTSLPANGGNSDTVNGHTVLADVPANAKFTDTNTTYSNFVKSGSGAKAGLVPAPSTTAGTTKYLREDGTWQVPPNTNTDTKVTNTLAATTKAYITGTTSAATNTGTLVFDTGVYLDTTAGQLTATTFKGALSGNAATATKAGMLSTARTIDGVSFDGSASIAHYATCSTAAATVAKSVDLPGFVLATGSKVAIKFTVSNTAANPTLNVNNTGAKAIYYRGAAISAGYLGGNRTYEFIYNGTQYELVGDLDTNTNTDTKVTSVGNHYKPSGGTTTSAAGGTLTDITNSANGVQVVTGVTKDDAGHVTGITSIALKSTNTDTKYTLPTATSSVLGGVKIGSNITNSSGVISISKTNITDALGYTPPTTNTTYSNMTAATASAAGKAGLVPAPAAGKQTSFLRGDGTWVVPTNTDTHYTSGLKVGATSTATANAAATNGNVYLNIMDNTTIRDSHKIVGSGATTVTSDANGVVTISSTNTTYGNASGTATGLVTAGTQHFGGLKIFDGNIYIQNSEVTLGSTLPTANKTKAFSFCETTCSTNTDLFHIANTIDTAGNNLTSFSSHAFTAKTGKSLLNTIISADASVFRAYVVNPNSSSAAGLRNLSSGTASPTTSNCPSGNWYGQYE